MKSQWQRVLLLISNVCCGSWQEKQLYMGHIFASPALLNQTIAVLCAWTICLGSLNLLLPNVPWPLGVIKGNWKTTSLKLLVFMCADGVGTLLHGNVFQKTHSRCISRISVLWVTMVLRRQFVLHLLHKYLIRIYYQECISLCIF